MNNKLLFTGSNGFLGKSVLPVLNEQFKISTLDLSDAAFTCNLSTTIPVLPPVDVVIHAAGKAHVVPKTKQEEKLFFDINYRGTVNLLKALENNLPKSFIFISTVAVYGLEEGELISEDFPLNGTTPYALSKIQAEVAVRKWSEKFDVPALILRLPLIAGKNAPGNLGQMLRAIHKGYYFRIGLGKARRSMVLAKSIAQFIPKLVNKSGIYHLTDGSHPSFKELEDYIGDHYKKRIYSIPGVIINMAAKLGDIIPFIPVNSYRLQKLKSTLTFCDKKAREELGWNPNYVIGNLW